MTLGKDCCDHGHHRHCPLWQRGRGWCRRGARPADGHLKDVCLSHSVGTAKPFCSSHKKTPWKGRAEMGNRRRQEKHVREQTHRGQPALAQGTQAEHNSPSACVAHGEEHHGERRGTRVGTAESCSDHQPCARCPSHAEGGGARCPLG